MALASLLSHGLIVDALGAYRVRRKALDYAFYPS
jgi:hypothetical protein